jgi:ribose-phosphate pyrophosphokinase
VPTVVVAGSASGAFAARLAAELQAPMVRAEAKRFPDGECSVRLHEGVRGSHVLLVQSTAPDANLVEHLLWQDAAREAGARTITSVVPYYGYARQDRVFEPGEALSSRAIGRALGFGCDGLVTVDLHKESVLQFLGGKGRAVSAVPQIAQALSGWGTDIVLAPDQGARSRAEQAAKLVGCRVDHLEKTRLSPTEVTIRAKALDVRGARVAIVDDLIASGGTMMSAAKELKRQGAKAVYAVCTHGLFTGGAAPKLLAGGIDRLLSTDTVAAPAGVDVVSAAPAVAGVLAELRPA